MKGVYSNVFEKDFLDLCVSEVTSTREVGGQGNTVSIIQHHCNEMLMEGLREIMDVDEYRTPYFDYFHSIHPVALHNDGGIEIRKDVATENDFGVIIPISWSMEKPPSTITFKYWDHSCEKMMFGSTLTDYKESDELDPKLINHFPKDCDHRNMHRGLTVDEIWEWNLNEIFVFDAKQLHSSSWFEGYKDFIVGFLYRHV